MANIKRRMRRRDKPDKLTKVFLSVDAACFEGNVSVVISSGSWVGVTGLLDIGLPDCDLPWLTKKIEDRLKITICDDLDDFLSVADVVLKEEKPRLLALAKNQSPGGSPKS
ncbi:unnamed protein product [marine sediment metagenome]|uniref:Uncharacterized protein n=2 Tax=marine sediment metagenome TaxID=412755 RepID=X1TDB5_9ZZZZ